MKKIWTIGMMLLLMSSCVKHADIYLKLSEKDAAAIPYREGQTVKFLNQDGDTVTYQLVRDEIYPYNGEQYINAIHGGDVMHPAPHSTECYARTVILYEQSYANHMCFTVKPGKEFSFYFISNEGELNLDMYLPSVSSYTINGIDYEHVHHEILYSHFTGELLYDWYYNEEFGLLSFTKGDFSITRIP